MSPQQIDWLIVYGPLISCNKKKQSEKNSNIVARAGGASYIFGPMQLPFKNGPINVVSLDEF